RRTDCGQRRAAWRSAWSWDEPAVLVVAGNLALKRADFPGKPGVLGAQRGEEHVPVTMRVGATKEPPLAPHLGIEWVGFWDRRQRVLGLGSGLQMRQGRQRCGWRRRRATTEEEAPESHDGLSR